MLEELAGCLMGKIIHKHQGESECAHAVSGLLWVFLMLV